MEMEKQMFSQQMLAGHAERMKHRAEFLQTAFARFLLAYGPSSDYSFL